MIRSIIDYGCILYHSASRSLLKKLDTIQCTSLTLVTEAMRGTALSVLLVDCDEAPLSVRRNWLIDKYLVKIKSRPTHNARSIIQDSKMIQLERNFSCRWGNKLSSISKIIDSKHISGAATSFHPPWTLAALKTDTGLISLNSGSCKRASNTKMQSIICKYLDQFYKEAVLVFTDGARALDGKAGAAVFIPSQSFKMSLRLSNNVSIDSAELEAIYQAIAIIAKLNIQKPVIVTDSMNAITSLSRPAIFENVVVHLCLELTNKMLSPPVILWIPSHVGFQDHDLTDQMAKNALTLPIINRQILPNVKDATDCLKNHYRTLSISSARQIGTGKSYHELFPGGKNISEKLVPRKKDVIITRLRFHNCRLNRYLHKIGCHPTGLCDVCGRDGMVEHFLLNCEDHKELSSRLKSVAISRNLIVSVRMILSEEPFLNIIYSYICAKKISV